MKIAAPKTGPTAKKNPGDRMGHRDHASKGMDQLDPDEINVTIEVPAGLQPNPIWHPVALASFKAFLESPLRVYTEDTDIVHAWMTCELIHQCISGRMGAGQAQHLRMYMNDLGFTESARRAIDVQINRTPKKEDPAKLAAVTRMQDRRQAYGS